MPVKFYHEFNEKEHLGTDLGCLFTDAGEFQLLRLLIAPTFRAGMTIARKNLGITPIRSQSRICG